MKFKYFLRGLGFGIVFASVVCLTAYQNHSSEALSDEAVIQRAKELGMVEKEDTVATLLENQNNTEKNTDNSVSDTSQDTSEEKTTETNTTEEMETTDTETTEVSRKASTKENGTSESAVAEEDSKSTTEKTVTITIERGSSSYPVCQKLQEAGMIEDASEFDTYLVENGYADRIRVGEHTLKLGMDFHDIAEAISDPL
jgi:cytoskeletal protein RodZ